MQVSDDVLGLHSKALSVQCERPDCAVRTPTSASRAKLVFKSITAPCCCCEFQYSLVPGLVPALCHQWRLSASSSLNEWVFFTHMTRGYTSVSKGVCSYERTTECIRQRTHRDKRGGSFPRSQCHIRISHVCDRKAFHIIRRKLSYFGQNDPVPTKSSRLG